MFCTLSEDPPRCLQNDGLNLARGASNEELSLSRALVLFQGRSSIEKLDLGVIIGCPVSKNGA